MRFYPFVFTGNAPSKGKRIPLKTTKCNEQRDEETGIGYCDTYQPHAVRRIYDSISRRLYDLRWDNAGNLGQISVCGERPLYDHGRFLFWTEDNHMHTSVDYKAYAYYVYDHNGERRLKMSGQNKVMDINANAPVSYTILKETTMYPSAYMVLTNWGYTKHYYAGTERLAARMGGGGLNALDSVMEDNSKLQSRADALFEQCTLQVRSRYMPPNDTLCIRSSVNGSEALSRDIYGIPDSIHALARTPLYHAFRDMVRQMEEDYNNGVEDDVFFYHSDHLGSASWITDAHGNAVQHLQYLPYGERYVDQRISGYSERFTFAGKERDAETGYGYFGARYMDHELMTMWLSVDPMSDKYPNLSPYAYCAWNPVKLVDPDGQRPIPLADSYKGWYVKVDSWFGHRNTGIPGASKFHQGLDINYSGGGNTDQGSPILATHNGVASVKNDTKGGEGRTVTITASNGKLRTRYFHLESINVANGDVVSESDVIATMGGSGRGKEDAYPSHLHYDIQMNIDGNWISIDPTMGMGNDMDNIVDPQKIIDSKALDNIITLKEVKITEDKRTPNALE